MKSKNLFLKLDERQEHGAVQRYLKSQARKQKICVIINDVIRYFVYFSSFGGIEENGGKYMFVVYW